MPSASATSPQPASIALEIGVEVQTPLARVPPQQETQRRRYGGVGEARQRLGRRDEIPHAADVGERDQQRRLALGAAQRPHQFGFVVVAPRFERGDERRERLLGRRAEQADEAAGVLHDQPPEVRRVIGEAEQQIAHALTRGERAEVGCVALGQQRLEAAARLGRRRQARRIRQKFGERGRHAAAFAGGGERRSARRQRDGDLQAGRVVFEPHGAAVHAHHRRGERQAEAGTGARARALQPHEAVDRARAVGGGNARPMVGDFDSDRLAVAARDHRDLASARRGRLFRLAGAVFDRVVDEIGDGLTDQFAIADDRQAARGLDLERDAVFLGERFVELGDARHRLADVERAHAGALGARLGARDQQKRVEDLDQAVRFLDRALQRGAIGRRIGVAAQGLLGVIAQARQRRAQIMGDIVGDFAHARHQVADAREHLVEAARQAIEFVVGAGDGKTPRQIAGHDRARRAVHRVDAPQHAARDEQRAERGQRGEEDQRNRHGANHDGADARAVAEIVPDQQVKAARQHEDARQRATARRRFVRRFRKACRRSRRDRARPAAIARHCRRAVRRRCRSRDRARSRAGASAPR